ncbi:MAG: phage integrase SAM-like domain-containing protein, partial [Candidatus Heimdallarchaeota archaeon]
MNFFLYYLNSLSVQWGAVQISMLNDHLSVTSVNMYLRQIKAAFNYAVTHNYIYENPAKEVKQIKT